MVAAPWYLFSGGIVLIIIGLFVAILEGLGTGRTFIHSKMSDKKISRLMKKEQSVSVGKVVMLVEFLLVVVSVSWRLVRQFMRYVG